MFLNKTSKIILFIFFGFFTSKCCANELLTRDDLKLSLNHIRSSTPIETQKIATLEVISRLLPKHAHLFDVEIFDGLIRSFQLIKENNSSKVSIRGSDGVSVCKGFYHYVKYYLNCSVSWSGNQLDNIPDELPTINIKIDSPSSFIYYQNVCTSAYSFVWWKWEDWRKHIDWMALMGISLTIAPIQEAIWVKIYRDFGLTENEIEDNFSGPAFLPWQRMSNVRGWGGSLSKKFMAEQLILQKQIIKAQRDLGMTVAIPAFSGHIPVAMERIYPNITFISIVSRYWEKWPKQYVRLLFIDPTEQLFHQIGEKFLTEVIKEYGTDHLYFADPFSEIQPPRSDVNYVSMASLNLHKSMSSIDPTAVWLLQNWMIVGNPFWTDNLLKAFLTAVPQGKILVLDLQSEIVPQYERTHSYYGQPFIWCMLHNYGGTSGMHGSIGIVNSRVQLARNMKDSTMIGVGITPEGINQNYAVYEFAFERGWINESINVHNWFKKFSQIRYGFTDENVIQSWKIIYETVYSYKSTYRLRGRYIITDRPSLNRSPSSWYNPIKIKHALHLLLSTNMSLYDNQQYQHDVVDLTRQFLQVLGDAIYLNIKTAYLERNISSLSQLSGQMLRLFDDLENILATNENFLLGKWLESAKEMGRNDLEKQNYEFNARSQITVWGPNGQIVDYATKQWSGLVKDYFMPRWKLFLTELKKSLSKDEKFSDEEFRLKIFKNIEEPFTIDRKIYPVQGIGNSVKIALQIYRYWSKVLDSKLINMKAKIVIKKKNPLNLEKKRFRSSKVTLKFKNL